MEYSTLISVDDLMANLFDPDWVVVDCRFSLTEPEKGRQMYLQGHIPGAVYASINDDLSSPHIAGKTGRHPLPAVEKVSERFSEWGIDAGVQVVAYDDWPVSLASAERLWWILRWLGHKRVAVLNGGWKQWVKKGYPQRSGMENKDRRIFEPNPNPNMYMETTEVDKIRLDPGYCLFDSRSADRFRGENETIDPVAGHIPGAISAPFAENFDKEGFFLPPEKLRIRFEKLLNGVPMNKAVFYCGSGVTAAVNQFATVLAGMEGSRIYPGSWSEWITDPSRPVEK